MQSTTNALLAATARVWRPRIHLLALVCFVALALLGHSLLASAGWITYPPAVYADMLACQRYGRGARGPRWQWAAARGFAGQTWRVPLMRSLMLGALWLASGREAPVGLIAWPWGVWVWQGAGRLWPGLARQPEWELLLQAGRWGEKGVLGVYLGALIWHRATQPELWADGWFERVPLLSVGPCVTVRHAAEQGEYLAEVEGRFTLRVATDHPFRLRLMVLFLRLLETPAERRGSRRTRDGRTPFVRQEYLAQALGLPQPDVSRWERYWQTADWRRLLSQMTPQVLTLELQQQIIGTWARWPAWGAERVRQLLVAQGVAVTESQVRQAAEESGWEVVRQELGRLCVQAAEGLRLREDWLVGDLLGQVQTLLGKIEAGERLTPEEQGEVHAWQGAAEAAGLQAKPPETAQPWLRRVEQVLWGSWDEVSSPGVCCPACGSSQVGRKGRQGRPKRFVDAQGQVQQVMVYRYRCHNRACARGSFTVYPPGLLPYTRQRMEVHVLALQMYAWGYSTYRRTAQALGVASMTAYRWVSAFGHGLLPMAALFGVVRSSGVVGVDEKWVQVPKNRKPAGEQRRWMYVYVAVDAYTYDLLHIAIYPHNTTASAQAFLLALRAKGYHPQVVVTDLRQDYGGVIARVFPQAQHHECLFHASQALHRRLAQIYGWDVMRQDATLRAVRQALDDPLQARTQHVAQECYAHLMTQRTAWVAQRPELAAVFAMLEAHWPKLANGIGSELIPRTNNTAELVIRRFDQHYQNFCGFDSLESAARYLGVFEKLYRFTPFSDDAQPRIRGQSPLQLAGYAVQNLPMAAACQGWAITTPTKTENVPSA